MPFSTRLRAACHRTLVLAIAPLALAFSQAGPALQGDGVSAAARTSGPFRTAVSPEMGMHLFIWGDAVATARDLERVGALRFTWQKSLFQWRYIEPARGLFVWDEADRVVKASAAAGIKVIARVDYPPQWARADGVNGPPDRLEDFGAFVFALADRYRPGSPHGSIAAIEMWNEPNLYRDWGGVRIGWRTAAEYVRLLCTGHRAAKRANPEVITITAALTPTGVFGGPAVDDVIFLSWLYDLGARPCFDVVGAHGVGFKAPPWISPKELAENPEWGGHASFGLRRVEQLREVMERYEDAEKQIWLTEFGWTSDPITPTFSWYRVTEQEKGEYIVAAFRWAREHWRPWIGVMVVWNMPARDWRESREEYWWSITNPDGSTRPAYERLLDARRNGELP